MEKYYIWLLLAFGESEPVISELISRFGTAEKAYRAFEENVALVGAELAARAEKTSLAKAEKLFAGIASEGITVITWESPDYPEHLRRAPEPPCALFAKGDTSLLHKKLITMVGSRAVTDYTARTIPSIIERLGGEYAIVGSLSEGCDQLICLNALRSGVPFIEIMPCGLSQTYPTGSRSLRTFLLANGGLLLSEYLPKTRSGQGSFRRRSRIIGGISQVTLVTQAGDSSGALATAEYSVSPLFIPPNDIFRKEYAGAVNAVRGGAKLYLGNKSIESAFERASEKEKETGSVRKASYRKTKNGTDRSRPAAKTPIKEEKAPSAEKADKAREDFESDEQYALYTVIAESAAPVGLEELIAKTGYAADTLAEALLDLEIAGAVTSAGNRYSAV